MTPSEALDRLRLGETSQASRDAAVAVLTALVVRDEYRSRRERREDFDTVAAAVRRDGGGAIVALSALAVCAGVPLVGEL